MNKLPVPLMLVKAMHVKFGINYEGSPRILSPEEDNFRYEAMLEEVNEFKDATTLNEKFDALIDLNVFVNGTLERMGLVNHFIYGYQDVINANMKKELGPTNKRGSFSLDLVKPEGWQAPDHDFILSQSNSYFEKSKPLKGIVVLDGPDASGKSTLASMLNIVFHAEVMHSTWNKNLEENMDHYILGTILRAKELSKEKLVVLDRSWMSEVIYSYVYRNGTDYPHIQTKALNLLEDAMQIVCLPNKDSWINNHQNACASREEMYDHDEKAVEVWNKYKLYWDVYKESEHFYRYDFYKKAEGSVDADEVYQIIFNRFADK